MDKDKPISIWIVEDDAGYRRNLRMSLEMNAQVVVGAVFPSCIELFEALNVDETPDVVLMDLGLPGMSGTEAIQKLAAVAPRVAVLVLTVFREKNQVQAAVDAGAAGYLLKESDGHEIIDSVIKVVAGGRVLSPALT